MVQCITVDCQCTSGHMQNRNRDLERLDAKGKATDLRALRISTVHEHWPRLAEAFEAKCAADAARKASKASKAAARLDQATAGMRQTLRAFLQQKPARAAAKPAAGALHVSFFAPTCKHPQRAACLPYLRCEGHMAAVLLALAFGVMCP